MNYILDIAIITLLIICLALLIMVLKKKNSQETDRLFAQQEKLGENITSLREQTVQQSNALYGAVRDEFSKSRLENNAQQSEQRKEITAQMGEMTKKIEK
ncbi:MAG: hypothetical protein J6V06_04430, partial [Clostridia bacterium]|nr:hypothetical protein [Clostridia bacterium]